MTILKSLKLLILRGKLIFNNSYFNRICFYRPKFRSIECFKLTLHQQNKNNYIKAEHSLALLYLTLLNLESNDNNNSKDEKNSAASLNNRRAKFNFIADVVEIVQPCVVQVETFSSGYFNQSSHGSGFIVSHDGYILTNAHVVSHQRQVKIKLFDGQQIYGNVVKVDELSDVAVIKINKVFIYFYFKKND